VKYDIDTLLKPTKSLASQRRLEYTSSIRSGIEMCKDGRKRRVSRYRFDIGRYLDRSVY